MKRLRDARDDSDPQIAAAARLLAAVAARTPVADSRVRILAAVRRARREGRLVLRPWAIAAVILLCLSGVARASFGHVVGARLVATLQRVLGALSPARAHEKRPRTATAADATAAPAELPTRPATTSPIATTTTPAIASTTTAPANASPTAPVNARASSSISTAPSAPTVAASPSLTRAPRIHRVADASNATAAPTQPPSVGASTPQPADESTLVAEAFVLLRREHQAATAAAQLDRYLAAHASGPLVEEALALRIEAAHRLADDAGAARFAADYLARFPSGHFAAVARAVVNASTHGSFGGANGIP